MNTRDILITDDQADRSPNWRGLRVSGMSRVQRDEHLFYGNGSLNRTMKHGLSWQTASLLHLIGSEGKRIVKIANTK